MLPLDLTLHVQFYLVAGSHYLDPEQCRIVNSDIKDSLKIDSKRNFSEKGMLWHWDYSTTTDSVSEEKFSEQSGTLVFPGTYCPGN